jgi:ABC-2 type transport system permease protein
MTASVRATGAGPLARLIGLGSVFGKTLRDSRRATLLVGGLIGLLTVGVAAGILAQFSTPESRREIRQIVEAVPPIMQGLAGPPVNIETLGGYLQYKYGGFFPLVIGLWSILALSGTLAGETRRGSLDVLLAMPLSRRRIAVQKVLGHVLMLTLAMALIGAATAIAGNSFAGLPGDQIPVVAAFSYAAWLGLMALVAGAVAFALAPFVGRGSAAGLAGALMLGGFLLNGYQAAIPELGTAANISWFDWTSNHIPLAGRYDWPSLAVVAAVTVALLATGVEAFVRRDVGATTAIPGPRMPHGLLGLGSPAGRAIAERLPTAVGWGIGLGIFGLLLAASGSSFIDQVSRSPEFTRALANIFPDTDFASVAGFLELVFIEFGLVLAGLAAAGLVGGWASDERSGRSELLLSAPVRRTTWPLAGAAGVFAGVAAMVALTGLGIAAGAMMAAGDIAGPVVGTLAIGLYAAAMAGVGIAVGGLIRPGLAAPTVGVLTVLTWLIDLLGGDIGLPDVVHELALSTHLGQPMLGVWDPVGIVACLLLAVGGTAVGTWGFARRDLRG